MKVAFLAFAEYISPSHHNGWHFDLFVCEQLCRLLEYMGVDSHGIELYMAFLF